MKFVAILLLVVVMALSMNEVHAQQATPLPQSFEEQSLAHVSRDWDRQSQPNDPDAVVSILTIAYSFASADTASAAFAQLPDWWFGERFGLGSKPTNVTELTVPTLGDESAMYQSVQRLGRSPDGVVSDVLFVRTGANIVILRASSATYLLNDIDVDTIRETVLDISHKIEGRTPSDLPLVSSGNLTRGGLFDLLPGYDDMPEGFTVTEEFPEVAPETGGTPVASLGRSII